MITTPYVRVIEYNIDSETFDRYRTFMGVFSIEKIIRYLKDEDIDDVASHAFIYVEHICKDIVKYGKVLHGVSPKYSFGDTPDWWGFLEPDLEDDITIDPRDITDVEYEVD